MVIVDDDSKDAAPVRRDGAEELDAEEGREDGEDDPASSAATSLGYEWLDATFGQGTYSFCGALCAAPPLSLSLSLVCLCDICMHVHACARARANTHTHTHTHKVRGSKGRWR